MFQVEKMRLGIVGAGGRPTAFRLALSCHPRVEVAAICDHSPEKLEAVAGTYGETESYVSFEEMLEQANLDAVIIGTPMNLHAQQSILALQQHLHVISEVPAGISLAECKLLAQTANGSRGRYLMAENCNYLKQIMLVKELVKNGLLGELYYAEGEYLHELKQLNELTKWRRRWQTGINGITYGTHSLGPILSWLDTDRIAKVSCVGSGNHYTDAAGRNYEQEDTCMMMAKTRQNKLIKIRQDFLSERPSSLNYTLQGTKGCYESDRFSPDGGRVWLQARNSGKETWTEMKELEREFFPPLWSNVPEEAVMHHGGSDYVMISDFLNALTNGRDGPGGIHEAMDITLPGIISQLSVQQNGQWTDVPDSRLW